MFNLIADVELLTFVSTRIMVEFKHDCVFNLSECKYIYIYLFIQARCWNLKDYNYAPPPQKRRDRRGRLNVQCSKHAVKQ